MKDLTGMEVIVYFVSGVQRRAIVTGMIDPGIFIKTTVESKEETHFVPWHIVRSLELIES